MTLLRIGNQTINVDHVTDILDQGDVIAFRFETRLGKGDTQGFPRSIAFKDPDEVTRIRAWLDTHTHTL